MTQNTYTPKDLPMFKPETEGHMFPAPDAPVAVCIAPCSAIIKRPPTWGVGQALKIEAGVHHIVQSVGNGDSYPNQEFLTFYDTGDVLDPDNDPRAAFLVGFWAGQGEEGHSVKVCLAKKTRPALVVGEVTDEMAGAIFENHEGPAELVVGSRILASPDDESIMWAVTPKVYLKKYADGGKILPGKPKRS